MYSLGIVEVEILSKHGVEFRHVVKQQIEIEIDELFLEGTVQSLTV